MLGTVTLDLSALDDWLQYAVASVLLTVPAYQFGGMLLRQLLAVAIGKALKPELPALPDVPQPSAPPRPLQRPEQTSAHNAKIVAEYLRSIREVAPHAAAATLLKYAMDGLSVLEVAIAEAKLAKRSPGDDDKAEKSEADPTLPL